MMAAPSSLRRAVVALLVLALGASAAVTVTSVAVAAPAPPTIPAPAGELTAVGQFPTVTVQLAAPSTGNSTGRVTVRDGAGVGAVCTAPVPLGATTFDCLVGPLSPGIYDVTAQYSDLEFPVDGDWSAESAPVVLRLGTPGPVTFTNFTGTTNEWATRTPALSGTGPVFGSVEVFFTYNIFDGNGVQTISYCTVENIPLSGLWSCEGGPVPSWASDSVTFFATGETVTGAAASLPAPTLFINPIEGEVLPPPPTVTYDLEPGSVTATLEGLPDHVVYGDLIEVLDLDYTLSFSSQPCPPLGLPPQNVATCTFSGLTPGIWNFSHLQEQGFFTGFNGDDFIRIPERPVLFGGSDNPDGSVLFSGTGEPGSTVHVRDAAENTICSGLVATDSAWDCTGTPPAGAGLYRATQEATGFVAAPPADFGGFEYRSFAGFSDYTDEVLVFVPPGPTPVTITPSPGAARIEAVGNPGSEVVIEIFPATLSGDPQFPYDYGLALLPGCTTLPLSASVDCTRTLTPGLWGVYVRESLDEMQVERDHLIRVPSAPTGFGAIVSPDRSLQFSGFGEPGFQAEVMNLADESVVCVATVASNGRWECAASAEPGLQTFGAVQRSIGFAAEPYDSLGSSTDGISPLSDSRSVTVPAPPSAPQPPANPVPTVPPTPTPTPVAWTLQGYDGSPLRPGQTLDLSAEGLPPQTDVVVEIRSTPQLLGTAVADDLGVFALTVTVPETLEPGDHTLVAIATPPGGVPSAVEIPVTVLAPEEVAEEEEVLEPLAAPPGGSDPRTALGGAVDRSDPAAPSAITASIPTLQRLFDEPWVFAAAGGLALALLLLVAFPAELLTSTLSANTGRLGRWFVALERRTEQVTEWFTRVSRTRALAAAVLVGLTSLIFGFVDPEFGFDPVSIRMTVSLAIGLFLITYVAAWIAGAIARRAWGVDTEVTLQPVALLFAVIGVVVARILEFSPGFLIGLVIGLDLISRVEPRVRARVVLLSTGVVVAVALAAWFAFSALTALSTGQPGWVELLISDTLVATTAEGLTAALAALLPLGFLAGYDVFRYSKPLWGVSFLVTGALFALIVLPTAAGETADVTDVGFWMLVMVIFAVVTLTLWALLHFTGNGSRDGDDESAQEDAAPATAAR